jgi:hypothetical protein
MPTVSATTSWRIDCKSTLQNWTSRRKCWNGKIDRPKRGPYREVPSVEFVAWLCRLGGGLLVFLVRHTQHSSADQIVATLGRTRQTAGGSAAGY